jgi:hypothetical protein
MSCETVRDTCIRTRLSSSSPDVPPEFIKKFADHIQVRAEASDKVTQPLRLEVNTDRRICRSERRIARC